jgi:alkylhydroperoxidase family enzyme
MVAPGDIAPLRAAGLSDAAIEDAITICALFNLIDRAADALGFELPTPEAFAHGAAGLLKRGYKM